MQPVLDAIAENAARFCGATDAAIYPLTRASLLRLVAAHGTLHTTLVPIVRRLSPEARELGGRVVAVLIGETIHVEDLLAVPETE